MNNSEHSVNVSNRVKISDGAGQLVSFQGRDHVDVSSLFSDTIDLDGGPGYLYVGSAGTLILMLADSTTALTYVFEQAGVYPLVVKRIMATGSDALTVYLIK